ncbi:MAG: glycosyltransferase family 4 protein [Eubacterium sp.]
MKIAVIGHKRIPSREGGIEIVVGELSSRMAAKGNDVVVYNRKSEHIAGRDFDFTANQREWKGVKIKWVPTPNSAKLNAIAYSALATARAVFSKYDIIHFHAEGPSAMVPLAKLFGKKCVVTVHGLDWKRSKWGGFATRFLKYGEKTAAKYADRIIVLSRNVQKYFKETYGRDTVYIPNGIEKPSVIQANIINEKYGLSKNGYILFLGRIVPEKGIHYLIEAYNLLDTRMPLVIAGGASHTNEYEAEIHSMAKDNKKIIFTGFVQGRELEELYSNAYVYCLPSNLEGMPISLLEAMSYNNCCLTSDIEECTEVCLDKALSFKKGDINDLADKLNLLLSNPSLVESYKQAAGEYICDKFNWDRVCEATLDLYKEVIER